MKIKLADLRPNPYRRMEAYPINPEKVLALQSSIKDTGFWENIVCRKSPTERGAYEIAYGHHRMVAAIGAHFGGKGIKGVCKPTDVFDLPVKPLDDQTMIRMMMAENMDDWKRDFRVLLEGVQSIIEAAERGEIDLPAAPAQHRSKGIVLDGGSPPRPRIITPLSIGKFLGTAWTESAGDHRAGAGRLALAFRAVRLIRDEALDPSAFEGIVSYASAEEVIRAAEMARREWKQSAVAAEKAAVKSPALKEEAAKIKKAAPAAAKRDAKKAANVVAENLRSDKPDYRHARRQAEKQILAPSIRGKHWIRQQPPDINKLAIELSEKLGKMLTANGPHADTVEKLLRVSEYSENLRDNVRDRLVADLDCLAERATSISVALANTDFLGDRELQSIGLPSREIKQIGNQRMEKTDL